LRSFHGKGVALSAISLAELFTGVYYSADPVGARGGLDDFLSFVTVLGINEEICRTSGEQNARLRKEGRIIEDFDLLIAAITISNYLPITEGISSEWTDWRSSPLSFEGHKGYRDVL